MTKLADTTICPDCRTRLDAPATCPSCGLVLTGPDADLLLDHMSAADRLVEKMRAAQRVPAPVGLSRDLPSAPPVPPPARPALPPIAQPAPWPAPRVSSLSVQVVLLAVGGLCLLVAAAVFVAISWSDLGLAGRTAVMSGVTALVGVAAGVVTRRGLRGAAETLWLLTGALVSIDVVAGRVAGLFGDLAPRHTAAGLGVVLVGGALVVAARAARTPTRTLAGPVAITAAGVLLTTTGEGWAAPHPLVASALAVPALAALAVAVGRPSALRAHGYAVAAVAGIAWLVLFTQGLARTGATFGSWWHDLAGWPLLVAAGYATAVVAVRRTGEAVRYVAATASLLCLVVLALGGSAGADGEVALLCAVAASLALVAGLAPHLWARPAAAMTAMATLVAAATSAARPFGVIADLPTTARPDHLDLGLRVPATTWDLSAWTAPVVALTAAVGVLALLRHVVSARRSEGLALCQVVVPSLVALGGATFVVEHRPALVVAVLTWSALVVISGLATVLVRRWTAALATGLVITAAELVVGLRIAVVSHLLVAVLATLAALAVVAVAARIRADRFEQLLVPALSAAALALAGFAATHWPYLVGGRGDAAGLALAGLMALAGITAHRLGRGGIARITIEGAALVGALVAVEFPTTQSVVVAVLTITGTAVALLAVLHRDREQVSWLASAVLAVGTAVRFSQDAHAPELVAVPAALLLVAAGVHRLRTDPGANSWRALGSGLSLGLVPSLLLTLTDPISLRGAILAAVAVVVLGTGIAGRWGAPFLAGAAVVAVLAVRHLGPVAAALPRWISLGSVGLVLLLVGVTWEARRRDAAAAERYLAALR